MPFTKKPSLMQGLVQIFNEAVGFVPLYIGVDTGAKLLWFNQTGGNGTGAMNANESLGVVQIPSGTTDGATITITNSQIDSVSVIFLSPGKGDPGKKLTFKNVVPGAGSATFVVNTGDGAATTAVADVWYLIID